MSDSAAPKPALNKSGSLCPAVKAADIVGDKWVLLILREMFLGTTRYNDFDRAIGRISPSVLSGRLKLLEANGLVIKRQKPGQKATEYRLTRSGKELAPIVDHLSRWGLKWARRQMQDEDIDVGSFMWDFHRTLKLDELPTGEHVFCVQFPSLKSYAKWWLIAGGGETSTVDLCTEDPGRNVDLYISGELPDLAAIWMGDVTVKSAMANGAVTLTGEAYLEKSAARWFPRSLYADVRPESSEPKNEG